MGTLVLFLTLGEILSIFHIEDNVCCGFIIYGFYYTEVCSFYAHFLECFYHNWMLNFVKGFLCIYWDNHTVFIFQLLWLILFLLSDLLATGNQLARQTILVNSRLLGTEQSGEAWKGNLEVETEDSWHNNFTENTSKVSLLRKYLLSFGILLKIRLRMFPSNPSYHHK